MINSCDINIRQQTTMNFNLFWKTYTIRCTFQASEKRYLELASKPNKALRQLTVRDLNAALTIATQLFHRRVMSAETGQFAFSRVLKDPYGSFTLHGTGTRKGTANGTGNNVFIYYATQAQGQGTGAGTNGLHTHFPIPDPSPVQCE